MSINITRVVLIIVNYPLLPRLRYSGHDANPYFDRVVTHLRILNQ